MQKMKQFLKKLRQLMRDSLKSYFFLNVQKTKGEVNNQKQVYLVDSPLYVMCQG